jgi:hypothetical protein
VTCYTLTKTQNLKHGYASQMHTVGKSHRQVKGVVPAPMPDEYSIHLPDKTSSVEPTRFNELLMLHSLRRARRAAASYLESPVKRDNAPISRIREPAKDFIS